MLKQKSYVLRPSEMDKKWILVDAKDQIIGRLATQIADVLRGKNSPKFTPFMDSGDFVVVINADKIRVTGNKMKDKIYNTVSRHIGGLKQRTLAEQLEKHPELVIMEAVKGMLPKNTLGRKQLTKLKVFTGEEHTHEAQKPEKLELKK